MQPTSVGSTEAHFNSYKHDPLNRVDDITQSGTSVASKFVDYAYDAAGRLTDVDRYAGTATSDPLVVSAVYTPDDASRLTHLTYSDASSQALADYDWTFDTASRITQAISPDGTATYGYDATDQLTSETYSGSVPADQTFVYDDNGNRTGGGYVTEANNRTTSDGTYTYTYDAEGNRTSRTETATGAVTEYEWDHRNRLTKIIGRASAGGTILKTVEYTYDPLNRRIAKTIDEDGPEGQDPETTYFIHDGDRASRDGAGDHVVLQLDGNGSITNHYLHGAAVDEILADENAAGDVLWPLTDHLGSVRDLAEHDDSTGATTIANHIVYDAFGNIASETDATVDHIFGYTGRERDDESDLQYNRARYYDAALGQFIGQDPIGFDAGDVNLYRYVGNHPTMENDPTGLFEGAMFWQDAWIDQGTDSRRRAELQSQPKSVPAPDEIPVRGPSADIVSMRTDAGVFSHRVVEVRDMRQIAALERSGQVYYAFGDQARSDLDRHGRARLLVFDGENGFHDWALARQQTEFGSFIPVYGAGKAGQRATLDGHPGWGLAYWALAFAEAATPAAEHGLATKFGRFAPAVADDVAETSLRRAPADGFHKLLDEGISGIDDVIESRAFRQALANDSTARRLYLRLREEDVDVMLDHRFTPGNLAGEVVENASTGKPQINIYLWNNGSTRDALGTFIHETRHADDILRGRATFATGNSLQLEARAIRRERIWEYARKLTRDEWREILWGLDLPGSGFSGEK